MTKWSPAIFISSLSCQFHEMRKKCTLCRVLFSLLAQIACTLTCFVTVKSSMWSMQRGKRHQGPKWDVFHRVGKYSYCKMFEKYIRILKSLSSTNTDEWYPSRSCWGAVNFNRHIVEGCMGQTRTYGNGNPFVWYIYRMTMV